MARLARFAVPLALALGATALPAQPIDPSRGVDPRVDYPSLVRFGPWDDRNYRLTLEDLAVLGPEEERQSEAIPAWYRVELRRAYDLPRRGPAQYPLSATPAYLQRHGGYLVDGVLYRATEHRGGRWVVLLEAAPPEGGADDGVFQGEARVTTPNGAAESAIALEPTDANRVIAGTNGPGGGQKMHFSTDGGATWNAAAALPGGGTCCDPTVGWSADGSKAYAATLGIPTLLFYRSADGGATWNDLGGAVQVDDDDAFVDKEYLHVDTFPTSPFKDRIYMTWHEGNILKVAFSSDFGASWSAERTFSAGFEFLGIGSDLATDRAGGVYHAWPAFGSRKIWVSKSTDGGASWGEPIEVASTEASFGFPLPSMETREVHTVLGMDADLTGGPFVDSIYIAWTDSTGPTSGNPSLNHGRIQVAYSRNGGADWTATTPHETADADTVDRYHPWIRVAADGSVHVIFYDTRRDLPNRNQVDIFHSVSLDGAATWSVPERITAEQSPNISDGFEFGDYNGLDAVMLNLLAIYTDNRTEAEGGNSVDVYSAGFLAGIFADGFESGDTSAWDSTAQ